METYFIPEAPMLEFIGAGMWVGHTFDWHGRHMIVASVGQLLLEEGQPVVPVVVQEVCPKPRVPCPFDEYH